jgi:hypothetical protein
MPVQIEEAAALPGMADRSQRVGVPSETESMLLEVGWVHDYCP